MVTVTGLDEFLRRVHQVDTTAGITATIASTQDEAARLVDQKATSLASSRQMARAERSNQYRATRAGVEITVGGGGGDREWAVGAQYGSARYHQFPGRRQPDGYTAGRAAQEQSDRIGQLYADEIVGVFP